ncbi:RNA dependent RNA polymerase-domain-containing protein [Xylaria nigripes]|nr:RNA dependent RNA polymerase-domain-containing protein [Xylaria nigripes]
MVKGQLIGGKPEILKQINAEKSKMKKAEVQKCRILVPKSRLLFGVCDAWGVLKEGQCHVKVTTDENGLPQTLKNAHVLVTRNPCLHPGDLQKFELVSRPELSHLVDCIVFPIRGRRPSADMMSGGDLDGDTFFVCWDEDLMPSKISQPAEYPAAREPVNFKGITDDDRLEYFSQYFSGSLGRVKNLYLDWAKVKGPMAPECQELNRLFSQCVDGNSIKVPQRLESVPKPAPKAAPFVIDVLHEAAEQLSKNGILDATDLIGYDFDAIELLLNRDGIAISEFELVQLAFKWCRSNRTPFQDLVHFFDFNSLTAEEKAWTISQLPALPGVPSLVMNALCSSSLVSRQELSCFGLDHPRVRWKRIYDSSHDRMATFLEEAAWSLELFHRKLIILRVDERLTIAIYIPKKVERLQDCLVDDCVRLFAFPHSQGPQLQSRLCLPTKTNYRLCCGDNSFQLFEGRRSNTWIHIRHGGLNENSFRNITNKGDRRRQHQETLDTGLNFDFIVSVALDKFSRGLQRHIGKVNRNGVLAAEIYAITNRDVQSMHTLDLWLEYIDTEETMPLFDEQPKEYSISPSDLPLGPEYVTRMASHDLSFLKDLQSLNDLLAVFKYLREDNAKSLLLESVDYLLRLIDEPVSTALTPATILRAVFESLDLNPFLSICFARIENWNAFPEELAAAIQNRAPDILRGLILSANDAQELVLGPMKSVLRQIQSMSSIIFAELVELVALTVRSPALALDIFLECFEPESTRLLEGDEPLISHFKHNMFGIALDHIGEADENAKTRDDLLHYEPPKAIDGKEEVDGKAEAEEKGEIEFNFRIDAPGGAPERSAHVRLKAASLPTNAPLSKPYSMDALVIVSEKGKAKFRCLHPLPPYYQKCSWQLTYCAPFVTTKSMFDAVTNLATDMDCCSITEQLLGFPSSPPISFPFVSPAQQELNSSQNAAVAAALEHPLVCLWGPPGTGKTQTIVAAIIALEKALYQERILVTAPTHNAVDNVMRRYLAVAKHEKQSVLRISTEVRKVAADLRPYTLDAMAGMELYSHPRNLKDAQRRVKACRLVFTTCIGAGIGLLRKQTFEASSPPEQSIAVLTPYTQQLEVLTKKLAGIKNIEVSSIDGYQGREADIVVFVTTRCNESCEIGFLKDLRRMNVALTRAKAGLIIIGNRATLTQGMADAESTAMWRRLLGSTVSIDLA